MISRKQQRLNCIVSLWAIRNYLKYPIENHPRRFDQLGADLLIGHAWKKNVALRLLVCISLPFIMLFYDFAMICKYSLCLLLHKKEDLKHDTLFVSIHERLYSIGTFAGLIKDNAVWFKTPMDSDLFSLPKPYKTLTVYDFIRFSDIWRSIIQSIRCRWHVILRWGYENMMITEKCFRWLLTDMAFRRMSPNTELVFCNQIDRIAVLLDKLPNSRKTLVEHGVEYIYSQSEVQKKNNMLVYCPDVGFYVLNRTYHFHTLTKVYCYSETDIKAFERSIVRCNPEYIVIGYNFKPSFKPSKKSVLIISDYYNQYENEKKIISLLQGLDIELFLKGHPRNNDGLYDNLRSLYHFVFIPGTKKELPDADLVISYDSTLAHEYESVGSKVLYYGNFEIENIRSVVSSFLRVS